MNYSLLLVTVTLFVAFTACKQKEAEPAPTRTELLTARTWKIQQVKANNNPISEQDIKNLLGVDNAISQLTSSTILFKSDGTYTATNKTTQAATDDTWTFLESDTKLQIKIGTDTFTFSVDTLTNDKLTISTPYTYTFNGLSTTVTVTLELIPDA